MVTMSRRHIRQGLRTIWPLDYQFRRIALRKSIGRVINQVLGVSPKARTDALGALVMYIARGREAKEGSNLEHLPTLPWDNGRVATAKNGATIKAPTR